LEATSKGISNPEFLKEGDAINDFMRPDRIVVGVESERAMSLFEKIYKPFVLNGHPVIFTDIPSAEMIKYAAEKGALNHAIRNLNNLNYNIVSVCPSYVETSFNKGKDLPMMSVQYLALVVDRIVNDFYKFGIKTLEIVVEKVK
jgi:hypothetical protein